MVPRRASAGKIDQPGGRESMLIPLERIGSEKFHLAEKKVEGGEDRFSVSIVFRGMDGSFCRLEKNWTGGSMLGWA